MRMKNKNYTLPLALVFSLFFLWAISSNLLPTMIRQLMKTCELNTFEASFTESAYWLAYFIFPIPIAMFMKRYSYKAGIVFGLLLAAIGGLLFFPAAAIKEYWAYLCIFFIIATGMCFLETAANPYVTALGDPATAPRRLNLAQSFNGLGAFIAAMFLSKLILSGDTYTRETLPMDYSGGWDAYIQMETDAMKLPYMALALLLLLIAVVIVFSKLPKIGDEGRKSESKEKLIDFGVLKHKHLRWGVIAQFFYNGGQTAINSLFLVYCCTYAGLPEATATTYFGLYMLMFLLGRWIGTGLMVKFRPQDMLLVYGIWRSDRTVCHVGYFVLYEHHVSYAVFFGIGRVGRADQKRFGFLGHGDCRQCLSASVYGIFDAYQRTDVSSGIYRTFGMFPFLCLLWMEGI